MSEPPHNAEIDATEFSGATSTEHRELQAAFDRDKRAGEWNSLPTAIDRVVQQHVADNDRMYRSLHQQKDRQLLAHEGVRSELVLRFPGWNGTPEHLGQILDYLDLPRYPDSPTRPAGGES